MCRPCEGGGGFQDSQRVSVLILPEWQGNGGKGMRTEYPRTATRFYNKAQGQRGGGAVECHPGLPANHPPRQPCKGCTDSPGFFDRPVGVGIQGLADQFARATVRDNAGEGTAEARRRREARRSSCVLGVSAPRRLAGQPVLAADRSARAR